MRKLRNKAAIAEREAKMWRLRQRGYTLEEIGDEFGVDKSLVCRILAKLTDRTLKQTVGRVERVKVEQSQILWQTISEAMRAWESSKEPLHRVREGEDGQRVTEVVKREGNTQYLHTAMKALADIRSIWGLDVAPALQEPALGIAQLVADLQRRGLEFEAREAELRAGQSPEKGGE